MLMLRSITTLFLIGFLSFTVADDISIGSFSQRDLSGWQEKEFSGQTHYTLSPYKKHFVLASLSSNSASGLFKTVDIDLNKTPIIHWSWKIKSTLNSNNERIKSGDDFAARIYIVFSDGPFFWQTRTLNYVWANQAPTGEHWPNPFTSNAQMFAIQSGDDKANQWQAESRNVLKDIQILFGKKITDIKAIAIMTDTDQTGATAQAWFGDIWFSDQ
ncbi:MAG TPA: DUF3047 domain-containing protein [Cycloclasticus sp.]|jgi:hypothetical protein|nr:DUF3047 domain-containing protein [Cycloclasticus sp.]HIL92342.1 DUF3047 domain-containing protein [Cycloclasticus sp.]